MKYHDLVVEYQEPLATIRLNRPEKRNALSPELRREMVEVLRELAENRAIRAVILTGGDTVFAAGADVSRMVDASPIEMYLQRQRGNNMFDIIEAMPQPVIAAVAGPALGGGCELAMACDLRLAAESATFGQPEVRVGIMPGSGGTQRLARLVGLTRAKEMVLFGDPISAPEALRIGLVNRVVPEAELMPIARAWAEKLASLPPLSLLLAKQALNQATGIELQAALEMERLAFSLTFSTADQDEGMRAFLEKRKPRYTGA